MDGPEWTGSVAGRTAIKGALSRLQLKLPTAQSPHRIPGLLSIDHIAVPASAQVLGTARVIAEDNAGSRLSDHDAYTVDATLT